MAMTTMIEWQCQTCKQWVTNAALRHVHPYIADNGIAQSTYERKVNDPVREVINDDD